MATSTRPLPTFTETQHADDLMQEAHDAVERLVWQVHAVADSDEGTTAITLEGIGVVACLIADLDAKIADLAGFRDQLQANIYGLHALRLEQGGAATG